MELIKPKNIITNKQVYEGLSSRGQWVISKLPISKLGNKEKKKKGIHSARKTEKISWKKWKQS